MSDRVTEMIWNHGLSYEVGLERDGRWVGQEMQSRTGDRLSFKAKVLPELTARLDRGENQIEGQYLYFKSDRSNRAIPDNRTVWWTIEERDPLTADWNELDSIDDGQEASEMFDAFKVLNLPDRRHRLVLNVHEVLESNEG